MISYRRSGDDEIETLKNEFIFDPRATNLERRAKRGGFDRYRSVGSEVFLKGKRAKRRMVEDPRTRKRLNGERCGVARERISPVVPFEMARVGTDIIQLADLNFFLRPSRQGFHQRYILIFQFCTTRDHKLAFLPLYKHAKITVHRG